MDDLIKPFGEDAPSGENLEYETVFTDLLLAAQPGEERQIGDDIIAAERPNPSDMAEAALKVMEQSHDLRAGLIWANAELRMNGFSGFAKGTAYLHALLRDHWETCHPQLDEDDDDDPTMRVNSLVGLTDTAVMLPDVKAAPLTQSRSFGHLGLRAIAIAKGEEDPADGENAVDPAAVAAAFQDTDPEVLAEVAAEVAACLDDIAAINAIFDDKIPGDGPNLSGLQTLLKKASSTLANEMGESDEATLDDDEEADETAPIAKSAGATPGTINSPKDVEAALQRIIDYYARKEPSSPLPLLLIRAKKLVNADFLTIINDMAPDGIDNVNLVAGRSDEDDD